MAQYGDKNNGRATDPKGLFSELLDQLPAATAAKLWGEKLGEKSAPTSRERSIFDEFEQHFAPFTDFFDEQMRGERAAAEEDTADTEDSPKTQDSDDKVQDSEENSASLIEALDRHREAVAAGSKDVAEAINNLAEALRR